MYVSRIIDGRMYFNETKRIYYVPIRSWAVRQYMWSRITIFEDTGQE
jgi:hypothetical protein